MYLSKKVQFKYTDVKQKRFNGVKRIVAHNTLLSDPVFNKTFDIHANYNDLQLVEIISQKDILIEFNST